MSVAASTLKTASPRSANLADSQARRARTRPSASGAKARAPEKLSLSNIKLVTRAGTIESSRKQAPDNGQSHKLAVPIPKFVPTVQMPLEEPQSEGNLETKSELVESAKRNLQQMLFATAAKEESVSDESRRLQEVLNKLKNASGMSSLDILNSAVRTSPTGNGATINVDVENFVTPVKSKPSVAEPQQSGEEHPKVVAVSFAEASVSAAAQATAAQAKAPENEAYNSIVAVPMKTKSGRKVPLRHNSASPTGQRSSKPIDTPKIALRSDATEKFAWSKFQSSPDPKDLPIPSFWRRHGSKGKSDTEEETERSKPQRDSKSKQRSLSTLEVDDVQDKKIREAPTSPKPIAEEKGNEKIQTLMNAFSKLIGNSDFSPKSEPVEANPATTLKAMLGMSKDQ